MSAIGLNRHGSQKNMSETIHIQKTYSLIETLLRMRIVTLCLHNMQREDITQIHGVSLKIKLP